MKLANFSFDCLLKE